MVRVVIRIHLKGSHEHVGAHDRHHHRRPGPTSEVLVLRPPNRDPQTGSAIGDDIGQCHQVLPHRKPLIWARAWAICDALAVLMFPSPWGWAWQPATRVQGSTASSVGRVLRHWVWVWSVTRSRCQGIGGSGVGPVDRGPRPRVS